MTDVVYENRTWNPLLSSVRLTTSEVKLGICRMPPKELNVAAMADAYLRGRWLGGGGLERDLEQLPEGAGFVPVIRLSGSSAPFKVRQAAELVRHLGPWMVRACGGAEAVEAAARQAAAEGVPLWIARRTAHGPAGDLTVAVDRRSVRADVRGPNAPAVRLRGRLTERTQQRKLAAQTAVSVGDSPATLSVLQPGTSMGLGRSGQATLRTEQSCWELVQQDDRSSRLIRDGHPVAWLIRPPSGQRDALLLPLADVRHETPDPLDAVMAHFFAVSFGLGKHTGVLRFGMNTRVRLPEPNDHDQWEWSWHTGLRDHGLDTGSGLEKIVETDHSHNRSEAV